MNFRSATIRSVAALTLLSCLLGASGCSWLRGASPYEQSPESRPLEVPPDLSLPNTTQAMRIPSGAVAPAAASTATAAAAAFVLSDSKASAWRRVGVALERIEGVTLGERVELVGAYNLSYRGESFLVRVAEAGEGTRISAVAADGSEANSAAASALLGVLRQRLL
jgi:uncharacterized lipoprotein